MGTRGATCFAWNESSLSVAVAVRRKIILLALNGSDLIEQSELLLPEPALCMMWCGSSHLYVGCKGRYYMLLSGSSTAPVEVATPGSALTPCMGRSTDGEVVHCDTHEYLPHTSLLTHTFPLFLAQVLLGNGSSVLFFAEDGKPSMK